MDDLEFPANAAVGDTHIVDGVTYSYNGAVWFIAESGSPVQIVN